MSNHAFEKSVDGQGLYDITAQVSSAVASSGVQDGLATVFIQHTSASLLVQENADPAVQADLQNWLSRLVLENDPSTPIRRRARTICPRTSRGR